jgi:hypothetical protein
MDGRLELKGGSEKDRTEAQKWIEMFLSNAVARAGRTHSICGDRAFETISPAGRRRANQTSVNPRRQVADLGREAAGTT